MAEWRTSHITTSLGLIGTTGGSTWPAARVLASFLSRLGTNGVSQPGEESILTLNASRILELGSGTGWLGLAICTNTSPSYLLLTEQSQGGALEHLKQNIEQNRISHGIDAQGVVMDCCTLDFGDHDEDHPVMKANWDFVIGSDLVYLPELARSLPETWASLLRGPSKPLILYCHTLRRYDDLDQALFENAKKLSLHVFELPDADAFHAFAKQKWDQLERAAAHGSDGVPCDLFGEQRVVVYGISL